MSRRSARCPARRVAIAVLCAAVLTVIAAPSTVRAQVGAAGPPPPGEPRPLNLPPITDVRLDNGARLLVVPDRGVPLVTVDVVLPGGQATDPDGLEGVSLLTASLLASGTSTRSRAEIVGGFDRLGADLDATADADWTRISLVALTDAFEPALELMADVITDPIFPEARLETLRRQARGALAAQRSQPAALARRVMLREVYAGHPYGKQTTEATLEAIDRAALRAHHARWYRPGSAVIVVAGDVEAEDVRRRLNEAFADWPAGPAAGRTSPSDSRPASGLAPPAAPGSVPQRGGGIVLVHQPGAVQAEIRVGYPLPPGGAEGWTAVEVAAHHLGATPSGLLHRRLRDALGWTYAATATVERRLEAGVLEVAFAARNEVARDALGEALRLVDNVRARPMSDADLTAAVSFLTGVLPLRSETPQQLADRVSRRVLLGLDPAGVEQVVARLRSLLPGEVRRAFAEAVDPASSSIVVVGDAVVLQPALATLGDVRVERPDGTPISTADLRPAGRSAVLAATDLMPGTYRYRVTLEGRTVGELVREIEGSGAERVSRSELTLGPQTMAQSVTFGAAGFDFLETSMSLEQPGVAVRGEVRREGARAVGYMDAGTGRQVVDMELPPEVLVSDMLDVAVWLAPLEVGAEFRFPVASISNGTVANAVVRVAEETTITVPAGTFDVFRVEIEGAEEQTIWARREAPHVPIRVAPGDQPIVVELVEITGPAAGDR